MFIGANDNKLLRIAVFYDGGFFRKVRNYYVHVHPRRSNFSIQGVHNFVSEKAAEFEKTDKTFCKVVEAHYFSGRFSARESTEEQRKGSWVFQDILIREGVVQHYLPMDEQHEKGIDVWLSIETFDLAVHKRFDIAALIAGDGDYVPLVRKLNGIGTRVMLLGWDFEYEQMVSEKTGEKKRHITRTSGDLIRASTYSIAMKELIDDRKASESPLINGLFMPLQRLGATEMLAGTVTQVDHTKGHAIVVEKGQAYKFSRKFYSGDFAVLSTGMKVSFTPAQNGFASNIRLTTDAAPTDNTSPDDEVEKLSVEIAESTYE